MSRKFFSIFLALTCLGGWLHATAGTARAEVSLCPGVWTYFSDARALVHGDVSFVGCISNRGHVTVASFDTKTGLIKRFTLRRNLGADDHNNPSLVIRKDGRLMAFYSPHSGRSLPKNQRKAMYYRTSKRPYDITSWGKTQRVPLKRWCGLGYTYPNPIRLPGDKLFLAFRGACWHPTFTVLNLRTGRWSRPRQIIARNRHRQYTKYSYDGRGGVDIAYTKAHPHSVSSSVYYMKYRNGRFYRASGRRIGTLADLPFKVSQGDVAYNRASHGTGWVMDVASDPGGVPRVVLQAGGSKRSVAFRYASWTGSRWTDTFVAAGNLWRGNFVDNGHQFRAGGITLSRRYPGMVYLSRVVEKDHVIQTGISSAGTGSGLPDSNPDWQFNTIAGGPGRSCFRPVEGRGAGALVAYYFCGRHSGWRPGQFNTRVFGQILEPTG